MYSGYEFGLGLDILCDERDELYLLVVFDDNLTRIELRRKDHEIPVFMITKDNRDILRDPSLLWR